MPTREMLETILEAKLGDDGRTDSKGRGEDLAVNELEDLAAKMTGKEAAVLFPSGTQGNTSAILAYCRPGQKVMVDEMQHIYLSEKVVFDLPSGSLNRLHINWTRIICRTLTTCAAFWRARRLPCCASKIPTIFQAVPVSR